MSGKIFYLQGKHIYVFKRNQIQNLLDDREINLINYVDLSHINIYIYIMDVCKLNLKHGEQKKNLQTSRKI